MKKNLLLAFLFIMSVMSSVAQVQYSTPHRLRYSPNMTEKELYNIEFLQNMPKEDWALFTQDPRFDADKVIKIRTDWKEKRKAQQGGMQKSSQTAGQSNCKWIEPTNDYENPNTIQWPGSPGNSTDNFSPVINLGWNFNYFGQNFNQVVITTKGTIALGNAGYIDFTPSAFPDPLTTESTQQYDHISAFWTDFDFGASGELYYNLTDDALYVNYVNVGYWPNNDDRVNSFQIILTPDGSPVIGNGNNVQFVYGDMQFANSQISGATGGCGATTNLAVVGCDRVSGTQHYAFGRFNICDSEQYNGPYGVNANQQDGVDWLDGRVIEFNTSVANFNVNQPPAVMSEACDTITMCVGETFDFYLGFTSPEATQTTSITFSQSGTGFSATAASGNAAILNNAQFVASAANVGTNTVTITATDNGSPAESTTVTYVFIVDDIVPPPITISGVFTICAGQETELTASDGFDSYLWSTGQTGQTIITDEGGPVTVIGYYGLCSAVGTETIEVGDLEYPGLVGGNIPIEICPGIDTVVCLLNPENYISYQWSVEPGFDGEFVPGTPTDEACAQVTGNVNGNYRVDVVTPEGCEYFNIKLVYTTPVQPCESNEDNEGAHCDGLDPLDFCGYSVPPEDNFLIYGISTNQNGWQGSYINIYVYPADGGPMETFFFTTFGPLGQFDDIMIGTGDSMVIEYFSNGNNFAGNSLWVFNCGQNFPTIIDAPLEDGIVWSALSTCVPSALPGTWTVSGPGGWSFSDPSQMTTTWTPTQYGVYQLCFNNPNCAFDYCYDVEYSEPPTITMTPAADVLLCDNETVNANAIVADLSGNGTVTWTGQGVVGTGNTAVAGPYTNYTNTTVSATITNVCGSASDSFDLVYQPNVPEPVLNDLPLCNNGSVTLDPIAPGSDNVNLEYDWTPGNASSSTLSVSQPGTYSVIVSNDCDTSDPASANIYGVVAATASSQPEANVLECSADEVTLTVTYANAPAYTVSWNGPVDSSTGTVVADQDGTYCFDITDIFGCDTHTTGCTEVEISEAPTTNSGSSEIFALCPRECEQLDLISTAEDAQFSWSTNCSGYGISSGSGSIEYCADNVPQSCLGTPIIITGTVSNACGSDNATWTVQSNGCEVTIPNVFTPNGGDGNDTFEIKGLENYTNAELTVFNRWGTAVYESTNYRNDWRAQDLNEGTYWYLLKLPYGVKTEYKGFIHVIR